MEKYFVHPHGICETSSVGANTRIWAFAHVLPEARIGCDCNICDGVFIENDVSIGDRVTVKCGVQLWDGLVVENDVFIGPNVTFTNDRFPRSKVRPPQFLKTVIRSGASIGANATILPGLEIGSGAMIGAGAVVTHNVPPNAIALGNPARITGYVGTGEGSVVETRTGAGSVSREDDVNGVALHELPFVEDMRGNLSVGEFEKTVPFTPKRYFLVFDVPSRKIRGEHAHRACEQFLICVKGSCAVVVDNGRKRREYLLDRPNLGLHLRPMIWGTQYKYSPDAVLLVFASEYYDADDYLRDYTLFLTAAGQSQREE